VPELEFQLQSLRPKSETLYKRPEGTDAASSHPFSKRAVGGVGRTATWKKLKKVSKRRVRGGSPMTESGRNRARQSKNLEKKKP